jgi:hypothetical protein
MNAARKAVGEKPLVWDPIAAAVAQSWANQCNFSHNPNASAEYMAMGGKTGLGENVAAGAPTETVANAVASWVNEQADYDHATNTCATGKVCGHYTQVVWSGTNGVGCAKVHCTTNTPFKDPDGGTSFPNWDDSVCDFSPPGNVNGLPPY